MLTTELKRKSHCNPLTVRKSAIYRQPYYEDSMGTYKKVPIEYGHYYFN